MKGEIANGIICYLFMDVLKCVVKCNDIIITELFHPVYPNLFMYCLLFTSGLNAAFSDHII